MGYSGFPFLEYAGYAAVVVWIIFVMRILIDEEREAKMTDSERKSRLRKQQRLDQSHS